MYDSATLNNHWFSFYILISPEFFIPASRFSNLEKSRAKRKLLQVIKIIINNTNIHNLDCSNTPCDNSVSRVPKFFDQNLCEHYTFTLSCEENELIKIHSAFYGRQHIPRNCESTRLVVKINSIFTPSD